MVDEVGPGVVPPGHEHIGSRVLFRDGADWIDAAIYFAVDDATLRASLTINRQGSEPEYVEDIPHASVAGGAARYWLWPAEGVIVGQ